MCMPLTEAWLNCLRVCQVIAAETHLRQQNGHRAGGWRHSNFAQGTSGGGGRLGDDPEDA